MYNYPDYHDAGREKHRRMMQEAREWRRAQQPARETPATSAPINWLVTLLNLLIGR